MNTIGLIGRLGGDPELRHTPSGEAITSFRLAFEQGKEKPTGWVAVVSFGKTAEAAATYLHKGDEVGVEGRLQYREWDGENGKQRSLEIAAGRLDFLRKKGETQQQAAKPEAPPATAPVQAPIGANENPFDD